MKTILLLSVILLSGCALDIVVAWLDGEGDFPSNRSLLDPIPEEYSTWYDQVETCLNMAGDFEAIIWYVAEEIEVDDLPFNGLWEEPHTITILETHVFNLITVKHEMIHHVLQAGAEIHGTSVFDCATVTVDPIVL